MPSNRYLQRPVVSVAELPRQQRISRHPQHTFALRTRPWVIQPVCCIPVLAGETMRNLLIQSRVVSDPVKSPLIGWWNEYYFYYVKLNDMDGRSDFTNMLLDPGYDLSAYTEAAKLDHYHFGGSINWVEHCLKRVVVEDFRNDDEPYMGAGYQMASVTGVNMPIASINQKTWLDSVMNDDTFVAATDFDVDGPDANATVQASEVDAALRLYQWQLQQGIVQDMSYEDYLRTFGIRAPQADPHIPELIRYVKNFTYPTNHIDPTTGTPTSAVVWSTSERADKDRFFKEPGFIFGVTICRPKVYLQNQKGTAVGLLNDAFSWLPAVLNEDYAAAIKKVTAGANGPLPSNTDDYRVDMRDLFLYGDQFVNFALTETNANIISLPTAALNKRFAASADADELFVNASPTNQIRQDGVVSVTIAGRQTDYTPTSNK